MYTVYTIIKEEYSDPEIAEKLHCPINYWDFISDFEKLLLLWTARTTKFRAKSTSDVAR